jgi:hypothetical protein
VSQLEKNANRLNGSIITVFNVIIKSIFNIKFVS